MNQSLLEQTECSKFFVSPEMLPKAQELQAKGTHLDIHEVPSLDDLIHGDSKLYAFQQTFEEARWNPVMVLHSSGSTGKACCRPCSPGNHLMGGFRTAQARRDESRLIGSHRQ